MIVAVIDGDDAVELPGEAADDAVSGAERTVRNRDVLRNAHRAATLGEVEFDCYNYCHERLLFGVRCTRNANRSSDWSYRDYITYTYISQCTVMMTN